MSLNTVDKQIIEKLLQMGGGYVLDFTDRTMAEFFEDELGVQIYTEKFDYASGSKANRMRAFLKISTDSEVSFALRKLIEYIEVKISLGDFSRDEFPQERIDFVNKIIERLSKNDIDSFYRNVSEENQGKIDFNFGNNNGIYFLGKKNYGFGIKFSGAGNDSVYVYNDDPSIDCLALVDGINSIERIEDNIVYDGTSRSRSPKIEEVVLLKNQSGRYAAIKILDINRNNETVSFEYFIFSNNKQFKIAGEKKIRTDAYIDNDSIQIVLNKDVFGHVKSLLDSGHYYNAVEESYKIVRELLRSKTGEEQAHKAFSEDNQLKIFSNEPETDAEKDFRSGVRFLHMAIQNLRNEKSHTPAKELDKNLALHYIVLAGLSYDLIN